MSRLSNEERARLIEALSQAGQLEIAAKILGMPVPETLSDLTGVWIRSLILQASAATLTLDGQSVQLSDHVALLLAVLGQHAGEPVSRRELSDLLEVMPARVGAVVTDARRSLARLGITNREQIRYSQREQAYQWSLRWPLFVAA